MTASPDAGKASGLADSRFDQNALLIFVVVLCALPFLLGDQQSSLVSVAEIGITSEGGDPLKQLVLALLYLGGFALITWRASWRAALKAMGAPLLLLIAVCFASSAWSELPGVAVRRSIALLGTVAVGVYAGLRLDEERLVDVLLRSVAIVLLISLALVVPWPNSALDPEGRLRGVFAHKNALGAFAGLGILLSFVQATRQRDRPWHLAAFVTALSAIAMALSDSASPLPVLLLAMAVAWLVRRSPWLAATIVLATALVGIVLPWVASDLGAIAGIFGRDPEFSGRTRVWLFSLEYLSRDPLAGYGYGTFWNTSAGLVFFRWASFPVSHAHNGFLQLMLDVGLLGAMVFGWSLLATVYRATCLASRDRGHRSAVTFGYLAYFVAGNLTETRLLVGNELLTMIFIFMVVRARIAVARPERDAAGAFEPRTALAP